MSWMLGADPGMPPPFMEKGAAMTDKIHRIGSRQCSKLGAPSLDPLAVTEHSGRVAAPSSEEDTFLIHAPRSLTDWLNTEQAAAYLGIPVGSLRNLTSNGRIPYYKLGRRNRYKLSDLHELLLSGKRGS